MTLVSLRFFLLDGLLSFTHLWIYYNISIWDLSLTDQSSLQSNRMGKKNLTKSLEQKETLEEYYEKTMGQWSREDLEAIAEELGLTRQQVYKFLWDKKNLEKKQVRGQIDQHSEKRANFSQTHEFYYDNSQITTPASLHQAVEFRVDPSISIWAMEILKKEGWQLVAQNLDFSIQEHLKNNEFSPHFTQQTKHSTLKRSFLNEMMEIDDEPIYRLNKFEMVPEEIESQYPFLHRQDLEVKEEFLEEEIGLCTNLDNFIELKYSEKIGTKDKSALHHLKFDMIKSEKASSEEIFESKL